MSAQGKGTAQRARILLGRRRARRRSAPRRSRRPSRSGSSAGFRVMGVIPASTGVESSPWLRFRRGRDFAASGGIARTLRFAGRGILPSRAGRSRWNGLALGVGGRRLCQERDQGPAGEGKCALDTHQRRTAEKGHAGSTYCFYVVDVVELPRRSRSRLALGPIGWAYVASAIDRRSTGSEPRSL